MANESVDDAHESGLDRPHRCPGSTIDDHWTVDAGQSRERAEPCSLKRNRASSRLRLLLHARITPIKPAETLRKGSNLNISRRASAAASSTFDGGKNRALLPVGSEILDAFDRHDFCKSYARTIDAALDGAHRAATNFRRLIV
jgi:hypothetical protein